MKSLMSAFPHLLRAVSSSREVRGLSTLLVDPSTSIRDLKRQIITADYTRTLNMSEQHVSLEYVLKVANGGSWMRFWDNALEHGPEGTKASLAILNILSKSVFSDRACPIDNCSFVVPRDTPLCDHLLSTHLNLTNCTSPKDLVDSVISSLSDPESFVKWYCPLAVNSYVNSAPVYCLLLRTVLCVHVFVLYLYAALYASRYRGINYTLT